MMKKGVLLFFLCTLELIRGYGYDSGSDQGACGRPYRSMRMHKPPCDLERQSYCTAAGSTYPWHAVRRFIRENQGLMRRMYGDERHIAVLKAELYTNDVTDDEKEPFQPPPPSHEDSFRVNGYSDYKMRYSKQMHVDDDDDNELNEDEANDEADEVARFLQNRREEIILNTKFVYGEDPSMQVKLKDLQGQPKFRPTTSTTTNKMAETKMAETTMSSSSSSTKSSSANTIEDASVESTTLSGNESISTTFAPRNESSTASPPESGKDGISVSSTESAIFDSDFETTTVDAIDMSNEEITTEAKKDHFAEVLFQDMEQSSKPTTSHHNVDYKMRGVNACPVKEEVVAPFWANNTRGEVLALLNLYPFEQYVHWEKCTFEHRQMYCREGCRCEQQYRLHRLLAYDPNNECRGIFSDWFRFPSCCVCKCYDMPAEFRVTSRSPRSKDPLLQQPQQRMDPHLRLVDPHLTRKNANQLDPDTQHKDHLNKERNIQSKEANQQNWFKKKLNSKQKLYGKPQNFN